VPLINAFVLSSIHEYQMNNMLPKTATFLLHTVYTVGLALINLTWLALKANEFGAKRIIKFITPFKVL